MESDLRVTDATRELVSSSLPSVLGHRVENFPENRLKPSRERTMRSDTEPLSAVTSGQNRPELEARCFGMRGRAGWRPPWPSFPQSPAPGTWLSQKTQDFFPFQVTAAAQKLWAFLEEPLCPPDLPATSPEAPVSWDIDGWGDLVRKSWTL